MRDRESVDVEVLDIDTFDNGGCKGVTIRWVGNIGFGEYTIYKGTDGKWRADSEYMDSKDDHWFLDLLLNDFVSKRIEEIR